jgi:uncharacterized membrane protein
MAAKQLITAITMPQIRTFKEVVMIEYMRKGLYAIGFATSQVSSNEIIDNTDELIGIFVPSTPTPVSGVLIFVPRKDIIPLDIKIEEAMKLLVSGGIVSPTRFRRIKPDWKEEEVKEHAFS